MTTDAVDRCRAQFDSVAMPFPALSYNRFEWNVVLGHVPGPLLRGMAP